ncbi:MAG: hypothetical protein A3I61_05360 [Acidobacteria bacterium RIFCSPLOWO2_02_FULL_68_18]|nr:MAG: hypothetical protein A3I61_05360 [Acidobacteria bacterium RIFCSPLOWO2_02_FULL_68_18]OFW49270.1 MAG: hypothetical protein A3G77_04160 [Acidobacteria bacterium RIFCSPLOWO2_12_FULL_68_19]
MTGAAGPIPSERRVAWVEDAFLDVLATFEPSSRELLSARALQQRVDRKFVLPVWAAGPLLARLHAGYRVVHTGDKRLARYEDLYFDTPGRDMYHDHHRGRRPRFKVRIRHHLDRERTFLEVKRKGANDRTTKWRLELPFHETTLEDDRRRFIEAHAPLDVARLTPCLAVAFVRSTLVGVSADERLTFDWHVEFSQGVRLVALAGVVIAEVKQARYRSATSAVDVFRAIHLREQGVSKYCLATSRLAAVRTNRFRPALRTVERLATCENS